MGLSLVTERLWVRSWSLADAEDALAIYGVADVTGWLTPATDRVGDAAAMRSVLAAWIEADPQLPAPRGRWAIAHRERGMVVGGLVIRLLPPYAEDDLELSFQLRPDAWGHGYAAEAAAALVRWAFGHDDVEELFAVARPDNTAAAATARRVGMQWVGETDKYYDRVLHVYRIRPGDLATDPMVELPDVDRSG